MTGEYQFCKSRKSLYKMNTGPLTIETRAGDVLFSTKSTYIGSTPKDINSPARSKRSTKSSQKGSVAKKEIIFPIFEKIAKLQTNDKWVVIFEDMATSKFPPRIATVIDKYYNNNKDLVNGSTDPSLKILTLIHKVRKQEKKLDVFNNPPLMSREIKEFIRKTTDNDYDIEIDDIQDEQLPVSYVDESKTHWAKLKPKDREFRLQKFVSRYSKDKNLTPEQTEDLETELLLLEISKNLPEEIIKMNETGEIVHISGIRINEDGMINIK